MICSMIPSLCPRPQGTEELCCFNLLYSCTVYSRLFQLHSPAYASHKFSQAGRYLITPWLAPTDANRSKTPSPFVLLVRKYCPHQLDVVDLSAACIDIDALE